MSEIICTDYAVTLQHDNGLITITTAATSRDIAVHMILAFERAPRAAVVRVQRRPICDYCDVMAMRIGDGVPLCVLHAREHYARWRQDTRKLGIRSFEEA
ncbi:hypothetical protein GCM10012275_56140 [Longimycelium tulufanense]|uniref:Uncharacterized protein n=1 Tax=Longimycelium tulufanense TaxID=907463 RepID=A0A8J3CDH9_9PSEU|nr:hypothetical protein [Longimycelium tulufanense]GGM78266.1 hypothetical protein GCM10012275_56140 [Longimycelium tulufanense]